MTVGQPDDATGRRLTGAGAALLLAILAIAIGAALIDSTSVPPVTEVPRRVWTDINADATTLDIYNVQCEQLLHATLVGTDGVAVRWEDGPETCAPIGGMDILVGDEVFRLWWCSLPNGVQLDWRNVERDACDRGVITLGSE